MLIGGAVFLPYLAVVMANAARSKDDGFALLDRGQGVPEIDGRPPQPPIDG